MATVVGLRRPRAGDPAVEVVLDTGDRLRVHDRRLSEQGIAVGAELDRDGRRELERASAIDAAERRALQAIARRPRSRSELARKLEGWGVGEADAEEVLGRLHRIGVLDDGALAAAVASSRRSRSYGRLRIEADLDRMGVDTATTRRAAAAPAGAEAERAQAALAGRYRTESGDPGELRRAAAYLARRGFDADAVAAVLGHDDSA